MKTATEHACKLLVFTISELQETKTSEYHRISHSPLDYRILLMDEDQDRIYVGSKDHILSLNINNISQDPLSVSIYFENPRFLYCMNFFLRQKMCISLVCSRQKSRSTPY